MPQKEEQRVYKMGDDVLMQKADSLVVSMERDADDFKSRNIDSSRREEITITNEEFKDLPTDPELLGLVGNATEIKDATVLELRKQISSVRSRAKTKYGKMGKFKVFNFGELSSLSDTDLYYTAKRVVRVGTKCLSDLSSEGLTVDILKQIASLACTLDINIDKVDEAIENRDIQKQERIKMGNNLWALMVKYAAVGKSLFEFSDEARYNDYVLTDRSSTKNDGGN